MFAGIPFKHSFRERDSDLIFRKDEVFYQDNASSHTSKISFEKIKTTV